MKVIFEQGDIVLNNKTLSFGIVLEDMEERNRVAVLTVKHRVVVEFPLRNEVDYIGEVDLRAKLKEILNEVKTDEIRE